MNTPPQIPSRPRVLHCITHLNLGGAERVALDLARGLHPEFAAAVFAVHGVSRGAVGEAMRRELADTPTPLFVGTPLPLKWGGLLPAGMRAARAVARFQPDVVHLHTEIPEACFAAALTLQPHLKRTAIVRTIHNSIYWAHWPRLGRWCDRRLAHAYVAGVSQDAVEGFNKLRHSSAASAPPEPAQVIFNGVNIPPVERPRKDAREPMRVLFAGRFEPQKGTDLLPRILAHTRTPQGRSCELILFGHGEHERLLRALAAHPPSGWTVKVSAPIADLRRRMPEFDVVIMPSRFEGMSLVALEAALLGIPLVATDAPGLREQLPPDYPWRATAGDADAFAHRLQGAMEDPARATVAAAQLQAFVRDRFNPRVMLERYRALYLRASAGRGR